MRAMASGMLLLAMVAGCGEDDEWDGDPIDVTGIMSTNDGTASGRLVLGIEATTLDRGAAAQPRAGLHGTVTIFGEDTELEGTYNPGTFEVEASGGGYVVRGSYDGLAFVRGGWTGPGGTDGRFEALVGDGVAYCGTFESGDALLTGTFSFSVTGDSAVGLAMGPGGFLMPLDGRLPGTGVGPAGAISFYLSGAPWAAGQVDGDATSGSFLLPALASSNPEALAGTWSGSTAACSA